MYIIPGYVKYSKSGRNAKVFSQLLQNEVVLTEEKYQKEFSCLMENGCEILDSPLKKFLNEQEMLITKDKIDQGINEAKTLMDDNLLLTIIPTEACNFSCQYCYERKTPAVMSSVQIEHIKTFLLNNIEKYKLICLSWFGGEPTLCLNTIIEITSFIQKLKKAHGFSFRGQMTTNGYLLSKDIFVKLYDVGITEYQVTLDGWNHDTTRPLINGGKTLKTIVDNLNSIAELPVEYNYQFLIRYNYLAHDKDYSSWYHYLKDNFGSNNRFRFTSCPVCDWGGDSVKKMDLVNKESISKSVDLHEKSIKEAGLLLEELSNEPFAHICTASFKNGYVFSANGNIEKCTIALGNPLNIVGKIDSINGIMIDETQNRKWYSSRLKDECYKCSDLLSCLNLCCMKKIIIDGEKDTKCFSK